jgi:hypothetical protein
VFHLTDEKHYVVFREGGKSVMWLTQ